MAKKNKKQKEFVFDAFLASTLRRAFKRFPAYSECLKRAKVEVFIKGKTKDKIRRVKYKCAKCGELFNIKDVAVDHIIEVICLDSSFKEMNKGEYIERLFCSVDNLQVLCNFKKTKQGKTSCHYKKTQEENKKRREFKSCKKK